MTNLVSWDKARKAIEEATSVDELKNIRDRAESFRQYAKKQKQSFQIQNKVAEVRIRCERRIGEMLDEMPKNKGAATQSDDVTTPPPTLEELGISKNDSSRWQAIASIPEARFEQHIVKILANKEELTTISFIELAKVIKIEDLHSKSEHQEAPKAVTKPLSNTASEVRSTFDAVNEKLDELTHTETLETMINRIENLNSDLDSITFADIPNEIKSDIKELLIKLQDKIGNYLIEGLN